MTDHHASSPTTPPPSTNGARMPLLGFGTWQIKGDEAVRATAAALEAGYRHLDTATVYGNESEVGRALAESGVARDDVFVTTKCPPNRAGRRARRPCAQSLDLLGTDHVDLWLIHWPGDGSANADLWRAFVEAREAGLARDIGVSNFDADADRRGHRGRPACAPAVNQIEWSPLLFDADGRSRRTGSAASCSRATARCAAAPSTTRDRRRSPSGSAGRRPR